MPKFFDSIPDDLAEWALTQPLFFTASAPLHGSHINLSPKGLPKSTFAILSPNQAAYLDATGSGSETLAHVYENGRVTVMFCSYERGPRILRFFCRGSVIEYDDPRFRPQVQRMGKGDPLPTGVRAVILLDVVKVQTSCGFGVPLGPSPSNADVDANREFIDRPTLAAWAGKMAEKNELRSYQAEWNSRSLDGLPGLRAAMREAGTVVWWAKVKARAVRVVRGQREGVVLGVMLGWVVMWVYTIFLGGEGRGWR